VIHNSTMASDGEDRASSPESESSRLEYNRPVTAEVFRLSGLPSKEMLRQMWNVTEDDRTSRLFRIDGTTANEILARTEYAIRGRILECHANGGNGATRGSPQDGPYLARSFLIKLWRLKRDVTKTTMTHKEIYKSNIGRTLNAFKEQIKIKMRNAAEYLAQHSNEWESNDVVGMSNIISYQNIIAFYEQTIEDIDCSSKLLVEFANENNGWTIEDLGLPEGEPTDEDGGNDDEDEEEEEGHTENDSWFETGNH
jgi:hypothetical protein